MSESLPEPWLRGTLQNLHPLHSALLYSFQMAREDARRAAQDLTFEQIWARPGGVASIGFHLRHIPGSIDRLLTYVRGHELSPEQLAALKSEGEPGSTVQDLLAEFDRQLDAAAVAIRGVPPESMSEARTVGRKKLPTTVGGLLIHIAEHTQRHVGQLVTTAKIQKGS